MLNHCANSSCRAAFEYRLGGMFSRFTKRGAKLQLSQKALASNRTHDVQHFWLRGKCSKTQTLIWTERGYNSGQLPLRVLRRSLQQRHPWRRYRLLLQIVDMDEWHVIAARIRPP